MIFFYPESVGYHAIRLLHKTISCPVFVGLQTLLHSLPFPNSFLLSSYQIHMSGEVLQRSPGCINKENAKNKTTKMQFLLFSTKVFIESIPSKIFYWRKIVLLHEFLQLRAEFLYKRISVHHNTRADLELWFMSHINSLMTRERNRNRNRLITETSVCSIWRLYKTHIQQCRQLKRKFHENNVQTRKLKRNSFSQEICEKWTGF